ncbi:hemagglutinin repeat-containing protein [Campylobacter gastrosuis]|uniref:Hemagglutinin repeat-containing protein n=1 Tax=Campylobacter gastrosuis TaxID=2974576 RepID=A0ABT7HRG2_9BACT|nr:hemagglutinin repeat-containing protein [Campylobacter gastrosuis]MDL0089300.1 hemagglutinin repeat-containing protein [Campylobacter gastrosuis]
MLNYFDNLYKNANSLINSSYNTQKQTGGITGSLVLARHNIKINTNGDIYNNGTFKADNIILNTNNYTSKDANLIANNLNLNANSSINILSGNANTNNLSLNANDISIKGSNLSAKNNLSLNANNQITIDTIKESINVNVSGKDTKLTGTITTNQTSSLNANNINLKANDITLISTNLNASDNINLNSNNNLLITSTNDTIDLTSKTTSKGFLSKKQTTTSIIDETSISSNLNAKKINLISNQDTTIQGSNLLAQNEINISADNINLTPATYLTQETTQTSKSSFGGLSKSSLNKTDQVTNKQGSNLNSNQINLNANTINILASTIQTNTASINTQILNLISDKQTNIKTEFKQGSGILTATITDKGKIKEIEIPAVIKVKDKFILNGKDITDKLDTNLANNINQTLNSQEFKDNIIKELTSNQTTPIDEKTINQIKATLNSKEWENKTTTLSGIGALIITAIITYLTAGAGAAFAGGIGLASGTASATAVSAMTSAVITQTSTALISSAITGNKPNIDLGLLATNTISAGVLSYANFAFGTNALTENMNISDYAKNATINGVGQGITSQIKGESFKDGFTMGAITSILSDSALQMRKYVKDNYDYAGKNKEFVPENTRSKGVRGDEVKLAGSHLDPNMKEIIAPFGGSQTGERLIFGSSYSKGSFTDYVNEYFAGPHDFLSNWNYENIGLKTYLQNNNTLIDIASGLLLIPSAPFAIAPFIQDNMTSIGIYKDLKRDNKQTRKEVINKAKGYK